MFNHDDVSTDPQPEDRVTLIMTVFGKSRAVAQAMVVDEKAGRIVIDLDNKTVVNK